MTRRAPRVHGSYGNAEKPPPSTLAAQIVQKQTRQDFPPRIGEKVTFAEQLHELLHDDTVVQETNLQVNAHLIDVVAKLGLVPLAEDNPFTPFEVLTAQAINSIAVIENTIRRQPEVLFTPVTEGGPHLVVSFLPHLVALCGRRNCENLPILRLLDTALRSTLASYDLWRNANFLRQVLQECVDEAIVGLEQRAPSLSSLSVGLPPARSVTKLWPESRSCIALPHGYQTTVNNPTHVFVLAVQITQLSELNVLWRDEACLRLQRLVCTLRQDLEFANQWDYALERLLSNANSQPLICSLCILCSKSILSIPVQQNLASALVRMHSADSQLMRGHLVPSLEVLACSDAFSQLHEPLKVAIATWLCGCVPHTELPDHVRSLGDVLRQDTVMTDGELLTPLPNLQVPQAGQTTRLSRRKRRKVGAGCIEEIGSTLAKRIMSVLIGSEEADLDTLPDVVLTRYAALDEDQQCRIWHLLQQFCNHDLETACTIITRLSGLDNFKQSRRPRVIAMSSIRACVQSSTNPAIVSLQSSAMGQLCLASLHSSLRELRVAASQCLPAFIRQDLPDEMRTKNRQIALEYVRSLSDRDVACEQDTLVQTWAQIALVCGERELNLALLRLVDYLGHSNSLISAVAVAELGRLALAKHLTVEELLRPFWGTVAVSVIQDLHARPQKAQQLCDLLRTDLNRFLLLTQRETIPTLVLTKKRSVLQRIALARSNGTTVQDLCMQPRTSLTAMLALLLSQGWPDPEESVIDCLAEVAPSFQGTDLADLIKMDSVLVAFEMLKLSGQAPEDRKSRAYFAFQTFANLAERQPGQSKSHPKPSRVLAEFFDTHILGIMAQFSEVMEDPQGTHSDSDKMSCIKAIMDVIHLTGPRASTALPQIKACLESAMDQPKLVDAAFSAWIPLLSVLEPEEIAGILDQTFALIVRCWSQLSPDVQKQVHDKIAYLLRNHNQMVRENLMTLPLLPGIPLLAKLSAEIERLRTAETIENHCKAYSTRLRAESSVVVLQALNEFVPWLERHRDSVHDMATNEQTETPLSELIRCLLDATTKHSTKEDEAADLCARALGSIGCVDPDRVEVTRTKRQVLMLTNFDRAAEAIDWVVALFEDVFVRGFKSSTNSRAQGFLAYTMQELLRFCGFNGLESHRLRSSQIPTAQQQWLQMQEHIRITLTPFLQSRYVITSAAQSNPSERTYPGFSPDQSHGSWLQSLVSDLMWKAKGDNPKMIFPLLARAVRFQNLTVTEWILPYAILNVVLGGTDVEVQGLVDELLAILHSKSESAAQQDVIKLCSQNVFAVLDYMSLWLQEKRKLLSDTRSLAFRTGQSPNDSDEAQDMAQIAGIEGFLSCIPAAAIAGRAMECGAYARALFHWEQYIRQERRIAPSAHLTENEEAMYGELHNMYALIDEPDGLEGLGAHLTFLSEESLVTQHTKAGRWTAAQAWYEKELSDDPFNAKTQACLLDCLRETGQFASLLRYADRFIEEGSGQDRATILPYAFEAQWMTGDLSKLRKYLDSTLADATNDFNAGIGKLLLLLGDGNVTGASDHIAHMRRSLARRMDEGGTSSLQGCHNEMKQLHILYETDALIKCDASDVNELLGTFDKRLAALGSYNQDKLDILGMRRSFMRLRQDTFMALQIGSSWLTTAKIARKANNMHSAYNAVLQGYECGDSAAKLEESKLLWHDGHQRQAIQALEAAIDSGIFDTPDSTSEGDNSGRARETNMLAARAHLQLTKWLDASGQSQSKDMTERYQYAAKSFQRWEKGHYYLGKHYNKLLEAEKSLPKGQQHSNYLSGEMTRLTIENLMRSLPFGNKYWHETIPRVITLWLELGMETIQRGVREDQTIFDRRVKSLQQVSKQMQKYYERIPAYVFYTALPQLVSRITHENPEVWKQLCNLLTRIATMHPSQALWSLFAVVKAKNKTRVARGEELLNRLKDPKRNRNDAGNADLRTMIASGQRLSDGLLQACEAPVEDKIAHVSLSKYLGFNHKLAPSNLVVPVEATLIANLPTDANCEKIRQHKAFVQDKITIQSFADDVLVLSSLQRPRKVVVRGSDGKQYGLLCKPKDDLRKDQRLMEFNGIINRALKRDAESSKRRLYIKTYAVTPLSEESGTIEWIEGIKPTRDILLNIYSRKGIRPMYHELRALLNEACSSPANAHIFDTKVLSQFPPVLHEWFTETYSDPNTWFAARLRYARSAAVMSMTGHVLGLGDRHGENILLEESTGGVFHVDFNCLFDKGLTFEKPELVPFRLTHNMVDAMGVYRYEGPFRKSSELTLRQLRQNKDTLMTILETFLYDPTTDFVGKKKRATPGVPETPQEILDSVARKLKGLLRGETVPLSTEGYADALIREAVSPFNLASMYVGWAAFL